MRFYYVALKLKLKELLKNKAYVVTLGILPLLIGLIMIYGTAYIDEGTLKAGLWSDSILGDRITEILLEDEGISFIKYETVEGLEHAVATNAIECGFVIDPSIDKQKLEVDFNKAIKVVISPATMAKGALQEVVTATLYRLVAEDIAYMTLKNKEYMQEVRELKNWIHDRVESYYANGDLMQIVFVEGNSEEISTVDQKREGILRLGKGLIAVFIMISSLLVGVRVIEDRQGKIHSRFCTIGKSALNPDLPIICANIILQVIVGGISLLIMKWGGRNILDVSIGQEGSMLIVYVLCLSILTLLVTEMAPNSELWFSMIPMLTIAAILFCPIVIDFSSMQTWFRYISYFFIPYYYIGGSKYLVSLIGATIILGCAYKSLRLFKSNLSRAYR